MDSTTCIRPFASEDTARLLTIWHAASAQAHPFLTPAQLEEQKKLVGDVYLPRAETWVATLDDAPVGFIGMLDNFIGGLFVDPARHGYGIGRRLLEHTLALKGTLELEVYALNAGALGFYRHLGFQEVGRKPQDDNGMPFELIRLRR